MTASLPVHKPLGVVNSSFLVQKQGRDCGPLQQLRELTQNGIEAIDALGPGAGGRIVWDVDLHRARESRGRERKLSVVDTGTGLTGEEMAFYFGNLAASGRKQAVDANFGLGAKIALLEPNPHGVIWRSWRDGQGAEVIGRYFDAEEADGQAGFGLQMHTWPDGRHEPWRAIGDDLRPPQLQDGSNGTHVILLGRDRLDDTTVAPDEVRVVRGRWIARHLNTRYLRIPDHIELLVREGHRHNARTPTLGTFVRVFGQGHFLDQHAEASGTLPLEGARAHWWLLDPAARPGRHETREWASSGHVAVLHRGELFAMQPSATLGYNTLRGPFGLRVGHDRTVIYVEPDPRNTQVDSTRTTIRIAGEEPPWQAWGEHFREHMPSELADLQEDESSTDQHATAIHEPILQAASLYRIPRYRAPRSAPARPQAGGTRADSTIGPGPDRVDRAASRVDAQPIVGASPPPIASGSQPDDATTPPVTTSEPTSALPDAAGPGSTTAATRPAEIQPPEPVWVTLADGTRQPGELEDLAAAYDRTNHVLTINADWRGYTSMIQRWTDLYEGQAGARAAITALVREHFARALCEAVTFQLSLETSSPVWPTHLAQGNEALTPYALTAVAGPRLLIDADLKKRLAQRLGRR